MTKPPYPKKTSDISRPPRREKRSDGPATGAPRLFKRPRAEDGPPARANHRSTGSSATLIYGFHAARAALVAGRRNFIAMHATEAAANKLALDITRAGLQPRIVTTDELTRRLGANAVHQGVLLEAGPIEPIDLSEIVDRSGIVLVLDQITDPHNVGAILRTAAAFGVDALVTTTRHAPDFTGVVAKAASGGLDHVPIAEVTNLARALEELGQMGYFRVGLDSEGPTSFEQIALPRPVALVLGAEDKGLRRLTRENCDALARLDMPGAIKSLNVSNACAVALTLTKLRLGGGLPPI
ncbi:23S rRNA (guanosine(2251)-2'-O)-methyltransferase RlmB [Beijerinckia sp. L45]|uniref:23S rRNA (guanosine(2251)-2'-O)-methyltransferase RlmB n=1 Tax=Beijerinckia sp. L45 TaxID=1641855 RepID=UPI00131DA548|nr:23S rRNA (guanosine(2251)-2'-O)-methyltransferase RlmB [Beijerinckia sp. L45]